MHKKIRKRDGRYVTFKADKITNAIAKAGAATGEFDINIARKLTIKVLNLAEKMFDDKIMGVEDVQDIVEEVLLSSPYRKTARAYIIYREQHARLREIAYKMEVNLVDQYLKKIDWKIHENSNMDYSLQGLNNYISSEVSKIYWLNEIYPPEIKKAHTDGDFHIHDLSILSVYCVGWDLFDLLTEGFKGVSGKVESRPAKHLRSALGQVVNFFYTLQGEAAGAQAFSNFDTLLAPFIRYDNLTYKEIKQALQEFIFNINVPTRVGFQTPFTNVTLDVTVPDYYANQGVIIGGEMQKETYSQFQKEMDLFNKAFLEVMAEGDAKGRVFTFPIPTYNITTEFDWENPKLNDLWEMTAKYGVPYFSNFINSEMNPEDARSMCCRLRIDNRELEMRGGGLFGSNPLTGSIGVVTINMPRIGYLSRTEGEFIMRLEKMMLLAKESLEIKRKVLERFTEGSLYPYTKYYLRMVKERFNAYWKNHFSTIGLLGMNEACLNLFGCDIAEQEGHNFTTKVLDFMRDKLIEFQKETGNNYNLEATPAEGTSYRLAKLDKKKYPDIICANEDEYRKFKVPVFYTNSSQLAVNFTDDIFEALDLQDDIQTKYTGGTVFHVYVGERIDNPGAVKLLVRRICEKYRLPYFTLTPTFSVCPAHGYFAGEHQSCPKCGRPCEIYSRVVGYLRPVKQWNRGKQEEFKMRKTFSV
ncbi:MAG: ribonucleoside triphosphate reductase [Deltaproteobacteria bacterium]|nr:MAG: ribonucleoside triphosphate reductase [Deltaproteobacteria bacterium]RLC08791.1 MAG: ribonucleoside triphosphate reductase [Deltaproteobacteria bacterium]